MNRGKRSIKLNLKSAAAQEVLRGLIKRADVVIHSFLPDTAAKLGIDYERAKALKPDVIFCSISGYGEKGPLRNKAGYDLMMQAFSGMMSTTGYEGGLPVRLGASCIDLSTGVIAYGGIMTALLNRFRGAGGDWVRVSLLETAISLLGHNAVAILQKAFEAGTVEHWIGRFDAKGVAAAPLYTLDQVLVHPSTSSGHGPPQGGG